MTMIQLVIAFEEQRPQKIKLPEEEDLDDLYAYDPEEPWWNRQNLGLEALTGFQFTKSVLQAYKAPAKGWDCSISCYGNVQISSRNPSRVSNSLLSICRGAVQEIRTEWRSKTTRACHILNRRYHPIGLG